MDDKKIKVNIEDSNLKDILKYCKAKEQLVLLKKFGLVNWIEIPLQRIWKDYSLTRERVRQIESQALMRFRRLMVGNDTFLKVIEEAKKILLASGWILEEAVLISKLVSKQIFHFTPQELKLIIVSDFDITYLKRNKYINKCFYIDPLFEDFLSNVVIFMNDYFAQNKQSKELYEFIDILRTEFSKKYEFITYLKQDIFFANFFPCIRSVRVFDGKIGLSNFQEVYPKTIKLKLQYALRRINKPTHYQEMPAKIMEYFPQKNVKVNTVHNELVKNNDVFVNLGLGVYGLRERGYEWWQVQEIIVRILKKAWRPMTVKEICKELLKEKMVSPNTILLNLQKFKDKFRRTDKWIYEIIQ